MITSYVVVPIMLLKFPIILFFLAILFIHQLFPTIIPNKNYPISLNLYNKAHNKTFLTLRRYAGKGYQQHKMLSWTQEIFDCGSKFT